MAFFDKPDDDDRPKGGGGGKGGTVLTKDMGPLPVWGWAVVAVAGVFLYRMMTRAKAVPEGSDQSQQTPVPYPTGGVGGVFLIPSGVNSAPAAVTPPPATTPPAASTTAGLWDWLIQTGQKSKEFAYAEKAAAGEKLPYPAAGMAFLQQTHVQAALGKPHVISEGGVGMVFNPATGQKMLATSFNALPESQRMLLTVGDANAWAHV